jgi:transposase-like protein
MLSDSPIKQSKGQNKNRKVPGNRHESYGDQQKIDAVQTYILTGNLALTGRTLGIHDRTLKLWKTTEWWKELEKELRSQETMILAASLKKQVEKALTVVNDRLDNGNYVYNAKTGEMVRKPVDLKEAHKVVTDFIDRRHKLITTEEHQVQQNDIKKKLADLAKSFEEFATKSSDAKPMINVTDVIFAKEIEHVDSTSRNSNNAEHPGTLSRDSSNGESVPSSNGEDGQGNR